MSVAVVAAGGLIDHNDPMSVVSVVLLGVLSSAIVTAAVALIVNRKRIPIDLRYRVLYRKSRVRISMASVLRVECDGRYLLVANLHRPGSFAPLGGVYKYYDSARERLDELEFVGQSHSPTGHRDLKADLRGFVPAKQLAAFVKWFEGARDRETNALDRELQEELAEAGLPELVPFARGLSYRFIRTVKEHRRTVSGTDYAQLRRIDVYEPIGDEKGRRFVRAVCGASEDCASLTLVTSDQITRGRDDRGQLLASHTQYLLQSSTDSSEPPPIS